MVYALLALFLGALLWFVWDDRSEYQAFKGLASSADRRKRYRQWILKSFATFSGLTLVALGLLGRLDAFVHMPNEFASLAAVLGRSGLVPSDMFAPTSSVIHNRVGEAKSDFDSGVVLGVLVVVLVSLAIGVLVRRFAARRSGNATNTAQPDSPPSFSAGDIEAIIPRNPKEALWVSVLSVNAGLSEELFFRLALPLLLVMATGNAALSVAVAALIFGAVHFYQGWSGVVATTIVGAFFTTIYLLSGSIWLAVLLHALMDIFGLLSRALFMSFARRPQIGA